LKTAVLRAVRPLEAHQQPLPVANLAASFQAAVVDVLVSKTLAAARTFKASQIVVAGGVSANQACARLSKARPNSPFIFHPSNCAPITPP
jgi:N6-L-threonylcarbamoyladenine synthase